jgi:hypothetical protein
MNIRRGRRAAQLLILGFATQVLFQAALAAGAPWGHAAWGGSHAQLTTTQRIGSVLAVGFWIAAILVVRGRAAGRVV